MDTIDEVLKLSFVEQIASVAMTAKSLRESGVGNVDAHPNAGNW